MDLENASPRLHSQANTFTQLRHLLRGRVLALCMVILLYFIAHGLLVPVLPIYLDSLGATAVLVGLLMSVFGLGEGIFGFVWGSLADRIGIAVPLGLQMFGVLIMMVGMAFLPFIGAVFVLRFLSAALGAAIWPTGRGYLAHAVPPGSKGIALALFAVLVTGGMNLGSFISGAIVDRFGFSTLFLVAATISAIAGIVVVFQLRGARIVEVETRGIVADESNSSGTPMGPFVILSIIVFLVALVFSTVFTFVPLLMTDQAGLTATDVGFVFGVSGLVSLLILIPAGRLSDQGGYRLTLAIGLGLMLIAVLALAKVRTFFLIMLFTTCASVGRWVTDPPLLSLLSDITPLRFQGRSQGIYVVAVDLGIIAGPFLTGLFWQYYGPTPAFYFLAVVTSVTLIIAFFLLQEKKWQRLGAADATK